MRNEADALCFRTEKLLTDNGDKIPDDVKQPVTEGIEKLKEALKDTDNDDEVRAAMDDLNQKASAMGQAIYQAAQSAQPDASAPADDQPAADSQSQPTSGDDDVVDAEIVDDDNDDKK